MLSSPPRTAFRPGKLFGFAIMSRGGGISVLLEVKSVWQSYYPLRLPKRLLRRYIPRNYKRKATRNYKKGRLLEMTNGVCIVRTEGECLAIRTGGCPERVVTPGYQGSLPGLVPVRYRFCSCCVPYDVKCGTTQAGIWKALVPV